MRTESQRGDLNSPAISQAVLKTLIAEAGGEGPEGMRLVAETIMNRARERGISPEQVVMERGQYAPHSRALPAGSKVKMTDPGNLAAAAKAWTAAQSATDPTLGSQYFYSGSKKPTAKEDLQVVLQHGNHRFLADRSTVKELQSKLAGMGLYQGKIDGTFGPATQRAAQIFSETQGINDPAQALETLGVEPAAGTEAINAIFGPEAQTSPAAAAIENVFGQPDQAPDMGTINAAAPGPPPQSGYNPLPQGRVAPPPQTRYDPLSAAMPSPRPLDLRQVPDDSRQATPADLDEAHAVRERLAAQGQAAALAAPPPMADPRGEDARNRMLQRQRAEAEIVRATLDDPQAQKAQLESGLYKTAEEEGAQQPAMGQATGEISLTPEAPPTGLSPAQQEAGGVRERLAAQGQANALAAPPAMVDPRADNAMRQVAAQRMADAQATRERINQQTEGQYAQGDWREQRSQQALSDLPGPPEMEAQREINRANALGGLPQDNQIAILGGPGSPPMEMQAGEDQPQGQASAANRIMVHNPTEGITTTPEGNIHAADEGSLAKFLHMWDGAQTQPERQKIIDDINARNAGAGAPSLTAPAATAPQAPTISPQALNDGPLTTGSITAPAATASLQGPTAVKMMNQGKTRDNPLSEQTTQALNYVAAKTGLEIHVTSGGQEFVEGSGNKTRYGPGGAKATGSHRHDLGEAGDLKFYDPGAGRYLSMDNTDDLPRMQEAVKYGVQAGFTGVGAGDDYMGPETVHLGFGSERAWGAGGHVANAPSWITQAFNEGRVSRLQPEQVVSEIRQVHQAASEGIRETNRALALGSLPTSPSQPPQMADSGSRYMSTASKDDTFNTGPQYTGSVSGSGPNIPGPTPLSPQDEAVFSDSGFTPGGPASYTLGAPPAPYASPAAPAASPAPAPSFTVSAQPDDSRIGVTGPESPASYNPLSSAVPSAPAAPAPSVASYMSTASKDDEIAAPPNMTAGDINTPLGETAPIEPTSVPTTSIPGATVPMPAINAGPPVSILTPPAVAPPPPPPAPPVMAPPAPPPPVVQTPPPAPPVTKPFKEKVEAVSPAAKDVSKIKDPIEKAAAIATGADGKFDHGAFWDALGDKDLTQTQQVIAARTAAQGHFMANKLPSLGLHMPDMGGITNVFSQNPLSKLLGLLGGDQAPAGGIGSDYAAAMGGNNYVPGAMGPPGSSGNYGGSYNGPGSGSYGGGGMGGSQYGGGYGGGGGYLGGGTYGGAGGSNIGQGIGGAYRNR